VPAGCNMMLQCKPNSARRPAWPSLLRGPGGLAAGLDDKLECKLECKLETKLEHNLRSRLALK